MRVFVHGDEEAVEKGSVDQPQFQGMFDALTKLAKYHRPCSPDRTV